MLPIKKESVDFTIKPPTPYVLGICADIMHEVNEEVFEKEMTLKEVMKYQTQIAQVISVLSYESLEYPSWCIDFICKNVELHELQKIIQEIAVKCNPSFFLSCFQVAKESNPMMMTKMN